MRRLLPLLVPLALLAAACADGGHDMDSMGSSHNAATPGVHGGHRNSPVPRGARTIAVGATSFEFEPSTIEVDAGEPVAIQLSGDDTQHDFVLEKADLHVVAADRGKRAVGGFTAPAPGRYTFYCSVPGHRQAGMEGVLAVRS